MRDPAGGRGDEGGPAENPVERAAAAAAALLGRSLLVLYPRAFRREMGRGLVLDFRSRALDRLRAGGVPSLLVWAMRSASSMIWNAPAAWRETGRSDSTLERPEAHAMPSLPFSDRFADAVRDARLSARNLVRTPLFSFVVVCTLALGIGGTTAVFTVVRAVLVEPLPYDRPEQLVRLHQFDVEEPEQALSVSAPHFLDYRESASSFQALATLYSYEETGADLMVGENAERVSLLRVSSGYFEVLGTSPVRGRWFTREDETGAAVAILSESLWARLGPERPAVGGGIELDGVRHTVVGIARGGLEDPVVGDVDVWVPADLHGGGAQFPGNHYLSVIGRLAPGVTVDVARQEMASLDRALATKYPDVADDGGFRLVSLHDDRVAQARPTLLLLLGAAGLLLLIACINVANLQLVRALGRVRDVSVQTALGASRRRVARQHLTETALLAGAGGAAGVGLAAAGLPALLALGGEAVPRAAEVALDLPVLAFALTTTLATGLFFGVVPALRLSRVPPARALRDLRGGGGSRGFAAAGGALVSVQLALALVLLAGTSVLAASAYRLSRVDLGFRTERVLTFELNLPAGRYDGPARAAFHREMTTRLGALPGVAAVGATSWLPATGSSYVWGTRALTGPTAGDEDLLVGANQRIVDGAYFAVLDIPLLEGRVFDERDAAPGAPPVAVVSRSLSELLFPGASPLGQRIRMGGVERDIVGVVEDVAVDAEGERRPHVYHAHAQYADREWAMSYLVSPRDAVEVTANVREEIATADPQLVMHDVRWLDEVVGQGRARRSFAFVLTATFAGLALALSSLGLYGSLAHVVRRRRREIGVRVALGADAGSVAAIVARRAAGVVAAGLVFGVGGAVVLGGALGSLVYRTEPADPVLLAAASALLVAVSALATTVPVLRALRVSPRTVLAEE